MEGQTITVTLTLANGGQTAAGVSTLTLYDGHPDSGSALICQSTPPVAANGQTIMECQWTASTPGLHRFFAVSDENGAVNESDESNNQQWLNLYVGIVGPLLLNSGHATDDPTYTPSLGYGAVDVGSPDILGNCGPAPHQSYRLDGDGEVVYQFDNLLPSHFYHVDLTLYDCNPGTGRLQYVEIDGMTVAGPIDWVAVRSTACPSWSIRRFMQIG